MQYRTDNHGVIVKEEAADCCCMNNDERTAPRRTNGPIVLSNVRCNTDTRDMMAIRFVLGIVPKNSSLVSTEIGTSNISFHVGTEEEEDDEFDNVDDDGLEESLPLTTDCRFCCCCWCRRCCFSRTDTLFCLDTMVLVVTVLAVTLGKFRRDKKAFATVHCFTSSKNTS